MFRHRQFFNFLIGELTRFNIIYRFFVNKFKYWLNTKFIKFIFSFRHIFTRVKSPLITGHPVYKRSITFAILKPCIHVRIRTFVSKERISRRRREQEKKIEWGNIPGDSQARYMDPRSRSSILQFEVPPRRFSAIAVVATRSRAAIYLPEAILQLRR